MQHTCTIVMYHYVRDTNLTPFPDIKALSIGDFAKQLDWLQQHFTVLSYDEFESAMSGKMTLDRPTALLTFDDGFVDHSVTVAPLLAARSLSGVFFVSDETLGSEPSLLNVHKTHFLLAKLGAPSFKVAVLDALQAMPEHVPTVAEDRAGLYRYDAQGDLDIKRLLNYDLPFDVADALLDALFREYIGHPTDFARELYLSEEHVRSMASQGMKFGGHTKTHRVLSRLDAAEQRSQVSGGISLIKRLTGQTSVPFCYPYGHGHTYTPETIHILQECGYSMAFSTTREAFPLFPQTGDFWRIPRYDTKDLHPFTHSSPPRA